MQSDNLLAHRWSQRRFLHKERQTCWPFSDPARRFFSYEKKPGYGRGLFGSEHDGLEAGLESGIFFLKAEPGLGILACTTLLLTDWGFGDNGSFSET